MPPLATANPLTSRVGLGWGTRREDLNSGSDQRESTGDRRGVHRDASGIGSRDRIHPHVEDEVGARLQAVGDIAAAGEQPSDGTLRHALGSSSCWRGLANCSSLDDLATNPQALNVNRSRSRSPGVALGSVGPT